MASGTKAFAGKTALITGGASGIGRALGAELFRFGAHVVLADIDGPAAELAAKQVGDDGPGGSAVGARLDVRDGAAVQALVENLAELHGGLDLVFNNAGISIGGPTREMPAAYWDETIDVNLRGVVNGVAAAYPLMAAQGRGHIVNTASLAGLAPAVFTVAYSATKHAVVGLSTSLRPEAARFGVKVSVLCPGAVDTPILDRQTPPELVPDDTTPLTGREYMARVGLSPMPADRFARRALRQVRRNKSIIVVPRSARAMWYLHRLSPWLSEAIGRRAIRRVTGGAAAAPPAPGLGPTTEEIPPDDR
jgi:NAD(P)-dependent dehydrogenase (short-subunit alcohol dehydrogenase family)